MNIDLNDCIALVERELSPRRFEHSLGVMQVMGDLASVYALNKTTAMICGILHDVAKEFPLDRQLDVAAKNKIPLGTEYDRHPLFLHGAVGACYVAEKLGITDPLILDAIVHHSYFGRQKALSPLLCWCLRSADILEPSRDWEDIKTQLKPVVYSGNLGEGAYLLVKWTISFHEATSVPVHPNMRSVFQKLSVSMGATNSHEIDSMPV